MGDALGVLDPANILDAITGLGDDIIDLFGSLF